MNRHVYCVAAAVAIVLAVAGGALAGHQRPPLRPHPVRGVTSSIYEHTTRRWVIARQGCAAARRGEQGIVILDFGKPAHEWGDYGTILFSGKFAPDWRITRALLSYATAYVHCLPKGSSAKIALARGTSNYHPDVPSAYTAGIRWGIETNRLAYMLQRHWLSRRVVAAAADDAEPAWDPGFRQTRGFLHGFRMASHGHPIFDYGSLDGGVGAIWNAQQMLFVTAWRESQALPEIYNKAMADEWGELAAIARSRFHRSVPFAGVMTEGTSSCACGLRPHDAHNALAHALTDYGVAADELPRSATDITG